MSAVSSSKSPQCSLTISSVNVNGLSCRNKRLSINKMINDYKSDIILIQEAHDDKYVREFEFNRFKRYSKINDRCGGTAILVARNKDIEVIDTWYSESGNVTILKCKTVDIELTVGSYYASQDDITMANDITYIAENNHNWENTPTIIGMDRNFDPTKTKENKKYERYHQAFDVAFDGKEYNDLLDPNIGVVNKRPITRPNLNGGSSIDTMMANNNAINIGSIDIKLSAEHFSDHLAIHAKLSKSKIERGKRQWRIATTTCFDRLFDKQSREILIREKQLNTNWTTHLDNIMEEIRDLAIATERRLQKNTEKKREAIRRALLEITQETQITPDDKAARWKVIEHYKKLGRLTHLEEEIKKQPQRWHHQATKAERPTKQFFQHNKFHRKDPIADVKTGNGITNDTDEMKEIFRDYYKELYAEKQINEVELHNMINELKKRIELKPAHTRNMEKRIDVDEIETVIKNMPYDKAPGPDGLTGRVFKMHKREWAQMLAEVFDEINDTAKAPRCFVDANIVLLRKKATPAEGTDPRDWRPISLTNVVYKIFAKAWATRLGETLSEIIERHQTGFVPGRDIRDNIMLIQTIIEEAMEENTSTALLFVDWEKAFDRLSHKALHRVLEELKFPVRFRNAIYAIYRKCRARININDNLTAPFQIRSGVKQGCPLSPLLFILTNELLHCSILNDPDIKGYKITKQINIPNSGYADDTVAIVTSDKEAQRVMHHIDLFCKATAAKININKSSVMLTGWWQKSKYVPKALQNVAVTDIYTGERYLGLTVGYKIDRSTEWNRIINGIRSALNRWKHEKLSLMAKTTIVNALALSKLWFIGSIIPIPTEVDNKVKKIIAEFTKGNRKKNIIAIKTLMRPKELGGIGIHDPITKSKGLLVKWIRRYKNQDDKGPWKNLMRKYFDKKIKTNCLHPILQDRTHEKDDSTFWPIVQAWNEIAKRDHKLNKGDWVTTIRGKSTSVPMKIKKIEGNKVILKRYPKNIVREHKEVTENKDALLIVNITIDQKKKIKEMILPATEIQEWISSINTPQQVATNEWIYHALLMKNKQIANIWHVEKLKATPEITSFYYLWANNRIETRYKNNEGRFESICALCRKQTSGDHTIFECQKTKVTTKYKTLLRKDRESTLKEIKRALKNEDDQKQFTIRITLIIARERYATYWASRLSNTDTLETHQKKATFTIEILRDAEIAKERKKEIRKLTK